MNDSKESPKAAGHGSPVTFMRGSFYRFVVHIDKESEK